MNCVFVKSRIGTLVIIRISYPFHFLLLYNLKILIKIKGLFYF